MMLLPSFEKLFVLYDQVLNANRVGSIKLLHLNSINTVIPDTPPQWPLMLILDVQTQWSSTHQMMHKFFHVSL